MGFSSTALRWFLGNLADMTYLTGAWDEALTFAEQVIVGEPHYQQQIGFSVRAEIRIARGDSRGAAEDMDAVLQQARAIRDPQALDPALVLAAHVAHRNGDEAAARALIDELGSPERAAGTWVVSAALLYRDLARETAMPRVGGDAVRTPWSEAAAAIAEGDLVRAATILERTGARTLEAAVRLRAARGYTEEGRIAEAEAQLEQARAFWRTVGAIAYQREADEVLAQAS
jgi:hypothetical protein